MRWVIDASVAAKWFAPEHDSQVAFGMLDHELLAPGKPMRPIWPN